MIEYIHDLVDKHSKDAKAQRQQLSLPFHEAFEDLDNIHRLYATTGRRRNPALVLAKERIVAKIAKRQKELADLRAAEKVVKMRGGFASLVGGMGLITNKDNEAARRSRLTKANPKTKMSK